MEIGVLVDNKWIITILEQIGLVYKVYENNEELFNSDSNIIFSSNVVLPTDKIIVTFHKEYARIHSQKCEKQIGYYYKCANNEVGLSNRSFFANKEIYTIPEQKGVVGEIYDIENNVINGSGIIVDNNFISLPWDIFSLSFGQELIRRPFYSSAVEKHWVEVGPSIDNGALRRLIEELLYLKSEGRVKKYRRFVDLNKPIFSFRIDADGYTKESTDKMIEIIDKTGIRFSWYIDCENWRKATEHIKELKNKRQEIGVHCWHHMTYTSENVNTKNMSWGKHWLKKNGIDVKGVVAPFGYYNSGLRQAIIKLRFRYSSEFAYDVDNLPSRVTSDYWQIPIHMGCIGSLAAYGFTENEIFKHLYWIIEKQQKENGIAIIYGHPVARMEKYIDNLCTLINRENTKGSSILTMNEVLAEWIKLVKTDEVVENYDIKYPIEDCFVYPSDNILEDAKKGIKYLKEMNGDLIVLFKNALYKLLRG